MDDSPLTLEQAGTNPIIEHISTSFLMSQSVCASCKKRCGWKSVQEIWRLELPAQGSATPSGDDPSCGMEAEIRRDTSPDDAQIRVLSPK